MTLMTFLSHVTIGLVIGWLSRMIVKDRGVKLVPSLGLGVIGAMVGSAVVYIIDEPGGGFYAVIGAIGVLFTVNAFRKKDPIFGERDEDETDEDA